MTEELIETVRNNTILYDTSKPEYMKSKLKRTIWQSIANDLQLKDGDEAKNNWLKLRNCHREALRRQKSCLKNGASATTIKLWKYQKQMAFLKPYMKNLAQEGNLEDESEEEDLQEQSDGTDNIDGEKMQMNVVCTMENLPTNAETEYDNTSDENSTVRRSRSRKRNPTKPSKNVKQLKREDSSNILMESMVNRERRPQGRAVERVEIKERQAPADDELYHFFMAMYKITRKMSLTHQHMIRNNVFQVVSQAEAESLQINNNY